MPGSTRVCKSLEVLQQSVPLGSPQCCDLDFWTAVERLLALRLDTSTGPPFSMLSHLSKCEDVCVYVCVCGHGVARKAVQLVQESVALSAPLSRVG